MYELNNDWLKSRSYYSFFLQLFKFKHKKFDMQKIKSIFAKRFVQNRVQSVN